MVNNMVHLMGHGRTQKTRQDQEQRRVRSLRIACNKDGNLR